MLFGEQAYMPLKILHIEDKAAEAIRVKSAIQDWGTSAELTHASSPAEMNSALHDKNWEVILASDSFPDLDIQAVYERLHFKRLDPIFILLAGFPGVNIDIFLRSGAICDVVFKDRLYRLGSIIEKCARHKAGAGAAGLPGLIESRLAAIVDSSTDAIVGKTKSGIINSWNPGAEKLFGYSAQEIVGRPVTTLFPSSLHATEIEILARVVAGETVPAFETVRVHKSGKLLDVSVSVSPIRDQTGEIIGASKIARDISVQKQLHEVLREKEAFYRRIVTTLNDGMAVIDDSMVIQFANKQMADMLGCTQSELIGALFLEFTFEPDVDDAKQRWEQRRFGRGDRYERRLRRKDGSTCWCYLSSAPFSDESGEFAGILVMCTDISERKAAQDELLRYQSQLEAIVEARTQALKVAYDEAARLAQVKSTFLANMSHEIRTPLSAIINYAELIRESAEDMHLPDILADIAKIDTASRHLLAITNDVLDLAKIEAGKLSVNPEIFALDNLLDEIDIMARALARNKNNTFQLIKQGDLGPVRTDIVRLRQSLLNLISNAMKFCENGRVELLAIGDPTTLRFALSDTGIGMTSAQMAGLFRPFSQADMSTTKKFGGTGLGLALTKTLVNLLGGDISVTSVSGEGSTFRFDIRRFLGSD
jgi:PAS domain S-box-containing protein